MHYKPRTLKALEIGRAASHGTAVAAGLYLGIYGGSDAAYVGMISVPLAIGAMSKTLSETVERAWRRDKEPVARAGDALEGMVVSGMELLTCYIIGAGIS